jgi:hypothetical protein
MDDKALKRCMWELTGRYKALQHQLAMSGNCGEHQDEQPAVTRCLECSGCMAIVWAETNIDMMVDALERLQRNPANASEVALWGVPRWLVPPKE